MIEYDSGRYRDGRDWRSQFWSEYESAMICFLRLGIHGCGEQNHSFGIIYTYIWKDLGSCCIILLNEFTSMARDVDYAAYEWLRRSPSQTRQGQP